MTKHKTASLAQNKPQVWHKINRKFGMSFFDIGACPVSLSEIVDMLVKSDSEDDLVESGEEISAKNDSL